MTQTEIDIQIQELKHKLSYFLYGSLFTMIILFFVQKCTPEPSIANTQTITTKEVKGKFEAVKPVHEPIEKSSLTENLPIGQNLSKNDKSKESDSEKKALQDKIELLLDFNAQLEELYLKASQPKKDSLYKESIQLNKFSQTFDDENVKIDVSGIARGTVQSIKADYNIKKQPIKERVFALKTGVEYGNTTTLSNSVFKGNLEFENKKGNSFSYGYDTNHTHWLGAKITIFEIKR